MTRRKPRKYEWIRKSTGRSRFLHYLLRTGVVHDDAATPTQLAEAMSYPLIQFSTVWKIVSRSMDPSLYLLASHIMFWDDVASRQLQSLKRLHGARLVFVLRDAIWSGRFAIKQLLVMGSSVPLHRVRELPAQFFDRRCSFDHRVAAAVQ